MPTLLPASLSPQTPITSAHTIEDTLPGFVHPSSSFRMPIHHFMIYSMDDGLSPFGYSMLLPGLKTFAIRIDGQQATVRLAAKRPTSLISAFSTRVRFT